MSTEKISENTQKKRSQSQKFKTQLRSRNRYDLCFANQPKNKYGGNFNLRTTGAGYDCALVVFQDIRQITSLLGRSSKRGLHLHDGQLDMCWEFPVHCQRRLTLICHYIKLSAHGAGFVCCQYYKIGIKLKELRLGTPFPITLEHRELYAKLSKAGKTCFEMSSL